jgi:hypothetical protein
MVHLPLDYFSRWIILTVGMKVDCSTVWSSRTEQAPQSPSASPILPCSFLWRRNLCVTESERCAHTAGWTPGRRRQEHPSAAICEFFSIAVTLPHKLPVQPWLSSQRFPEVPSKTARRWKGQYSPAASTSRHHLKFHVAVKTPSCLAPCLGLHQVHLPQHPMGSSCHGPWLAWPTQAAVEDMCAFVIYQGHSQVRRKLIHQIMFSWCMGMFIPL